MKVKVKDGYLVIRIPLDQLPIPGLTLTNSTPKLKAVDAPVKVEHTAECLALRKRELIFSREWPVHCRTCAAKGYVPGAEGQKRACPRCIEFGLCPRCGTSALAKQSDEAGTYHTCPNCEWTQLAALSPSAEAAGFIAPVWRCHCLEEANA